MEKIAVVYHRVDFDGVFSALIAKSSIIRCGYEPVLLGYNYGDEFPVLSPSEYERICMVDVSFPPGQMLGLRTLYGPERFVYIDHHKTALEAEQQAGFQDLEGIRRDGTAACELCWEYFYPECQCPDLIQMLGAYDVWNKNRFDWSEVLCLQYALKSRYGVNPDAIWKDWNELLSMRWGHELVSLICEGEAIKKYLERTWKSAVKVYSFPVEVAGKYKGICMLGTEFSSNIFGSVMDKYDIYMVCNRKGPNTYNISMYKEPDRLPEFSCGGYKGFLGHMGAAGCTLSLEQFIELVTTGKI